VKKPYIEEAFYACEEASYTFPTMSFPKFDLSPESKGYLSKKDSEKIIILYRSLNFNVPRVVKYIYICDEVEAFVCGPQMPLFQRLPPRPNNSCLNW
jgi:hypothetical protein